MFFGSTKNRADEDQFDWIPDDPQAAAGEQPGAPRVLKAQATPLTMFFISLFVCCFWNGIISIFVVLFARSFIDGDPEWFLGLFLIPFVLVGLIMLLWVTHSFLSLFNPRPVITLLTPELWLGGRIEFRWHFEGNTGRIRQLKIQLVGQEKATYRRGTSTHTDTEAFAKIPIVQTDQPQSIASGQASADIPLRSMHSFKANRNEIMWSLVIEGDILRWPNVSRHFVLVVLPAPVVE